MSKLIYWLLLATLVLGIFTGCATGQQEEKVVVHGLGKPVPELSEFTYLADEERLYVMNYIAAKLIYVNLDEEYIPGVAESFEFSDGGKILTLRIRKGAKWSDGKPLTAEDVYWTFGVLMSEDYDGPPVATRNLQSIKSVKQLSTREVRITLNEVDNGFLYYLAHTFVVAPKHVFGDLAIEELVTNEEALLNPVGAGPFRLREFKPDEYIILETNPYWYGDRPDFDVYAFKVTTNQAAAVAALQAGEIDITRIGGGDIGYVEEQENLDVAYQLKRGLQGIVFNLKDPVVQDIRVRQAIAHALDPQKLLNVAYGGAGEVWPHSFAAELGLNPEVKPYEYNLEKSRELLAEAGYQDGLELTMITYYDSPEVAGIQAMLAEVGIKVNIETMDGPTWTERVKTEDYDLSYNGGWAGAEPDSVRKMYTCPAVRSFWCNERVTELMELASKSADQDKRTEYYQEVDKIAHDELPWLILMRAKLPYGYNTRIKNFTYHRYYWHDVDRWQID